MVGDAHPMRGRPPADPGPFRALGRSGTVAGMLFQLQDVTKTYGRVTALDALGVAGPPGAIGLLVPNGAGKTTLIRMLLGLIRACHEISVANRERIAIL